MTAGVQGQDAGHRCADGNCRETGGLIDNGSEENGALEKE